MRGVYKKYFYMHKSSEMNGNFPYYANDINVHPRIAGVNFRNDKWPLSKTLMQRLFTAVPN